MNRRKILIIVMIAATTVVGSTLGTINYLKNNKEKKVVEINDNIEKNEKENKEEDLFKKDIDNENHNLEDGEFIGEGKGYGGIIKVKVTVKNSKIANIEVLSHSETPSFFTKAQVVLDRIINKNSPDVDGVSGATLTSNGLKEAVINALKNHGFNDVENMKKSNSGQKATKNTNKINLKVINVKEESLKDGEYFGEAKGFRGNIKIKTIIKNGKISEIKLLSHNDDEEFISKAKKVIKDVLAKQALNGVDTVSGATYSSKGILEAISNATSKAIVNKNSNYGLDVVNLVEKNIDKTINFINHNETTKIVNENKSNVSIKNKMNISNLKDGEYIGVSKGFRDDIKVKAIIKYGKINKIELLSHNDDKEFMDKAKKVIENVLNKQSISGVDTVSGATYSSKGILEAISNATSKAVINNSKEDSAKNVSSNKKNINNLIDFISTETNKIMNVINPNKISKLVNDKKANDNISVKTNIKVESGSFKNGEYFGVAEGFRGDLKVRTTIKDGKIRTIDIIESEEDEAYLNSAKELISKILLNQNINNIDTISGATYSSKAILNAVKNSLEEMSLNNEKNLQKEKIYNKAEVKVVKDDNKSIKNISFEGKSPGYYSDKYIVTKVEFNDNKIDSIKIIDYKDDGQPYYGKAEKVIDYIIKKPKETIEDLNEFVEIYEKINSIGNRESKIKEAKKLIGKYAEEMGSFNEDIGTKINKLKKCIRKYMQSLNRGEVLDSVSGATYSARGIANSVKNAIDKSQIKTENKIKNINIKNKKLIINLYEKKNIDLSNLIVEIEYNDGVKKELPYNKLKENNIKIYDIDTKEEITEDKIINKENENRCLFLEVLQLDSLARDSFKVYFTNVSNNTLTKMEYSLDNGSSWSGFEKLDFYSLEERNGNIERVQKLKLSNEDLQKDLKIRIKSINDEIYELKPLTDFGPINERNFEPSKKDMELNVNLEYMYSITILNDKFNKLYGKDITVNQGEAFNPKNYITAQSSDRRDLKELVNITENTVNMNIPGEYKVTYTLGNLSKTIKVTVLGSKVNINAIDKTIFVGDKFDPKLNIKAISTKGKDLTSKMIVSSKVNVNKPGKYVVIYFVRDEENKISKKIIYVTVKEKPSKLNDGVFIGKNHGFYEHKFIQTKVIVEEGKVKSIDVSNEKNTYGDDMIPYRKMAVPIVDEILKDQNKTINDILEYDSILKSLSKVALKNHNSQDLINEGKRLIGDYSNGFDKIKIRKSHSYKDIERKVSNQVKSYLKNKGKGQALDTVSGATYSAVGITKSVKNAIDKSKTTIDIQDVVINGLDNNSYNIQVFDYELENKKLDLSKISVDVYYKDGQVKNIPFNKFEENKIELINNKTNKPIDLNVPLKDFEEETKIKLLNKEFLSEKTFNLRIKKNSSDFIKTFEYSLDDGKTWTEIKNPKMSKENLELVQKLIVDDKTINKKIIARMKSEKNNIYYFNTEKGENLIEQGKNSILFSANKEDMKKNNNIKSNYRLDFEYKLSDNLKAIIEAEDKTIVQGQKFNPLEGVKVTNKNGDNLIKYLIVRNNVNEREPGTYNVEYIFNKEIKSIEVTVKKIDKKTEFTVSDKTIKKGQTFDPKEGVKVISKTGKDITNEVKFVSRVDINKVGKYTVRYYLRDLDEFIRKDIKVTVEE
ncbi:FMN-binding protein [Clostridium tarantellae]|uniref:FMN-binding protein n=1 Tax=Clostridium tarantellae TaxID=39493 RepID=A0A6I1MMI8_9CLOT|nr:FMN-binding protein [Clostridium tarantellae]MPQ43337.1 FMN-binding protein [Clostridium tarantellae]